MTKNTCNPAMAAPSNPSRLFACFPSKTDEWPTPKWLFAALNAEFGFTLDPCATPENAKCKCYFTRELDGLSKDWSGHRVFMNPPYGRAIGLWMKKACHHFRAGGLAVCLVPARTDTAWWHDFAMQGEIRLLRGRVKFAGASCGAPFPSAVVIFAPLKNIHPYSNFQKSGAI